MNIYMKAKTKRNKNVDKETMKMVAKILMKIKINRRSRRKGKERRK